MFKILCPPRLATLPCWLVLAAFLAACAPSEVEPSLGGGSTPAGSPTAALQNLPTPFPSSTVPLPPTTPSAVAQAPSAPTLTAYANQGRLPPVVTPTPVPPQPGLVYNLEGQLWQVGDDWQPAMLGAEAGDVLSADGQRALKVVGDDIWMMYLPTGQRFNLTGNSGRVHCCPKFWPARPDTIVFGSWSKDEELGMGSGFLTAAKIDLSEYRVLDEEHLSNADPAPGPDGRTIAYDRTGTSWLYDIESGPQALDPEVFGLSNVVRIAGPSWSPDGQQLAWTVAVTNDGWRIAVAVFDLETGTAKLLHPYENIGRGGWFAPPAWSPDSRRLAFASEDADLAMQGVWVIEVESGAEIYAGAGIRPIWSPDGRWLLVTPSGRGQPDGVAGAWLIDTSTGYPLQMVLPPGAMAVDWLP